MGCQQMKIWHGKRFSCKVDAIEMNFQSRVDSNDEKDEVITITLEEAKLAGSEIRTCIYAVKGLNIERNIIDRSPYGQVRTSANGKNRDECVQDSSTLMCSWQGSLCI
ncbi:unnamed protein product [Linum trigynum]|uniref:Uncharacterized protein n=1 Tax=Linum trigynum TaxID=586398 RepID=A0AAV2CVN3_9ROSI